MIYLFLGHDLIPEPEGEIFFSYGVSVVSLLKDWLCHAAQSQSDGLLFLSRQVEVETFQNLTFFPKLFWNRSLLFIYNLNNINCQTFKSSHRFKIGSTYQSLQMQNLESLEQHWAVYSLLIL